MVPGHARALGRRAGRRRRAVGRVGGIARRASRGQSLRGRGTLVHAPPRGRQRDGAWLLRRRRRLSGPLLAPVAGRVELRDAEQPARAGRQVRLVHRRAALGGESRAGPGLRDVLLRDTPTARPITSSARPATPGRTSPASSRSRRSRRSPPRRSTSSASASSRRAITSPTRTSRSGSPSQKKADGKFDFNRPDPEFWRQFERRILDLQKLGIEADLILWHPYDRWGFSEMSDAEDDRYLRYCIARLSAYRNVWWSLANEYDFMTDKRPGSHGGNKQWEDWDRFFSILQKEDPHQRLRSIHNGGKVYDHTKPWVTHASLQTLGHEGGPGLPRPVPQAGHLRRMPVRGGPQGLLGQPHRARDGPAILARHAQRLLRRARRDLQAPAGHPLVVQGGRAARPEPEANPMAEGLHGEGPGLPRAAADGRRQGPLPARQARRILPALLHGPRKADADPRGRPAVQGRCRRPLGDDRHARGHGTAGEFAVSSPKPDLAFRFTPYGPGEELRPEAKVHRRGRCEATGGHREATRGRPVGLPAAGRHPGGGGPGPAREAERPGRRAIDGPLPALRERLRHRGPGGVVGDPGQRGEEAERAGHPRPLRPGG